MAQNPGDAGTGLGHENESSVLVRRSTRLSSRNLSTLVTPSITSQEILSAIPEEECEVVINLNAPNNTGKKKRGRKKKNANDAQSSQANLIEVTGDSICPHCKRGGFKGDAGVARHIASAHPELNRERIAKYYTTTEETEEEVQRVNPAVSQARMDEVRGKFQSLHEKLLNMENEEPTKGDFSDSVQDFVSIIMESSDVIAGPQNPFQKFYNRRKNGKLYKKADRTYKQTKNPKKASKRDREGRLQKFNHEMMQYLYSHCRKKCVNRVLNSNTNTNQCSLPLNEIFDHFQERWGTENNEVLSHYEFINEDDQEAIDSENPINISLESVKNAIKRIKMDTSPGPDFVTMKMVRSLPLCAEIIQSISNIMLKYNITPSSFHLARTVLIYKKGDPNDPKNQRPISICSVIRRIVEKVFELNLRQFVQLNENQRGFSNQPGTFINSSLLDGCLKRAKKKKEDFYALLLDITQAFDAAGHEHVKRALHTHPIPSKLRNIVISLQENNQTQIVTKLGKTKKITTKRGVFQGAPLSPLLFNIAVDHVFKSVSEPEVAAKYGFRLAETLEKLVIKGFADDTALMSSSRSGIMQLALMTLPLFESCGFKINFQKSIVICVKKGKLIHDNLVFEDFEIPATQDGEIIKYLGINFKDESVFDPDKIIQKFQEKLENLVSTPMLRPDQKIKIINQYLWPILIYPLMTAPLLRIPASFLHRIDLIVKSSVKQILELPTDTPDGLIYTTAQLRGLCILRAQWEGYLQHINICILLKQCGNVYIPFTRDLDKEMELCFGSLGLNQTEFSDTDMNKLTRTLRIKLRQEIFNAWSMMPLKGQGIDMYRECAFVNKKIMEKSGLTSSEQTTILKMTANVCPVKGNARNRDRDHLCRLCGKEKETLAHILGSCQMLLTTQRHHIVRTLIANGLRKKGWIVHEEVPVPAENRRMDILAYSRDKKVGYILDPTIRFERSLEQPEEVHREKRVLYEPCIPFVKDSYGVKNVEVFGLLIGARGTIPKFFQELCGRLGLPRSLMEDVALSTVKGSVTILNSHLRHPKTPPENNNQPRTTIIAMN